MNRMKRCCVLILILLTMGIFSNDVLGQKEKMDPPTEWSRCLTMDMLDQRIKSDEEYREFYERAHNVKKINVKNSITCTATNMYRIPVAFHFDEAFSCADAACITTKVNEQLAVLNAAYGNNTGTPQEAICPSAYQDNMGNSVASTGTCIEFYMPEPPAATGLESCDLPITIDHSMVD